MKCPSCGNVLVEHRSAGVAIDRCQSCGGVWFDAGELRQYLLRQPGVSANAKDLSADGNERTATGVGGETRPCPRCSKSAKNSRWRDVTIAKCDSCRGVFLDAEVLASLEAKSPESRDTPSKAVRETLFHTLGELAMAVFDGI